MKGRIYARPGPPGKSLLLGVDICDALAPGHVYEIQDMAGVLVLVDIGESAAPPGHSHVALIESGRHLLVTPELPPGEEE